MEAACPIPGEHRYPARRWVVERTLSWLVKRRSIRLRWCKKSQNWLAFLQLACAHILYTMAIFGWTLSSLLQLPPFEIESLRGFATKEQLELALPNSTNGSYMPVLVGSIMEWGKSMIVDAFATLSRHNNWGGELAPITPIEDCRPCPLHARCIRKRGMLRRNRRGSGKRPRHAKRCMANGQALKQRCRKAAGDGCVPRALYSVGADPPPTRHNRSGAACRAGRGLATGGASGSDLPITLARLGDLT